MRLTPRLLETWCGVTSSALAGKSPHLAHGVGLKVSLRMTGHEARACVHAVSLPELRAVARMPFERPTAEDGWRPLSGLADDRPMDRDGLRARRDVQAMARRYADEGFATYDGLPLPLAPRLSPDGVAEPYLDPAAAAALRRIIHPAGRVVTRG